MVCEKGKCNSFNVVVPSGRDASFGLVPARSRSADQYYETKGSSDQKEMFHALNSFAFFITVSMKCHIIYHCIFSLYLLCSRIATCQFI